VRQFRDSLLPEEFTYKEIDQYLYVEGRRLVAAKAVLKQSTIAASSSKEDENGSE
jgi:hypothetical protein